MEKIAKWNSRASEYQYGVPIQGGEPLGERGVIRNDILLSVPKHNRIHILVAEKSSTDSQAVPDPGMDPI
eukprot:SAG11_NODE_12290_length_710_cov_3.942717_1_plen_69_part_01